MIDTFRRENRGFGGEDDDDGDEEEEGRHMQSAKVREGVIRWKKVVGTSCWKAKMTAY